jgi:hypothetical protein
MKDYGIITLQISIDRVPLFNRKKISMHPIVAIIASLPLSMRFKRKYMFLVGMWAETGKFRSRIFLKPFLESLQTLGTESTLISCFYSFLGFYLPPKDLSQKLSIWCKIIVLSWHSNIKGLNDTLIDL